MLLWVDSLAVLAVGMWLWVPAMHLRVSHDAVNASASAVVDIVVDVLVARTGHWQTTAGRGSNTHAIL